MKLLLQKTTHRIEPREYKVTGSEWKKTGMIIKRVPKSRWSLTIGDKITIPLSPSKAISLMKKFNGEQVQYRELNAK